MSFFSVLVSFAFVFFFSKSHHTNNLDLSCNIKCALIFALNISSISTPVCTENLAISHYYKPITVSSGSSVSIHIIQCHPAMCCQHIPISVFILWQQKNYLLCSELYHKINTFFIVFALQGLELADLEKSQGTCILLLNAE